MRERPVQIGQMLGSLKRIMNGKGMSMRVKRLRDGIVLPTWTLPGMWAWVEEEHVDYKDWIERVMLCIGGVILT